MANLVVADVCNMRCTYCFAKQHLHRVPAGQAFISLDAFESRLDFLDRSNIAEIRLIGGEPTLHPHFSDLIQRARQTGKHLMVFSHGLMPEPALASLEAVPVEACTVLINMNASRHADGPDETERARRRSTLQRLGARALPGFTLFSSDVQLDFLLPLILETGCKKSIRLGLAQPVLGADNAYLHPKQYPLVGRRIAQFAVRAAQLGIRLEFDCGFVPCMFSAADLESLRKTGGDIGWHCNAVLDIGIDGQTIHCFPLTGHAPLPMDAAGDALALRAMLATRLEPYRAAGIYKECSLCDFKQRGECPGGCLASTMRRFRHTPVRLLV